LQVEDLDKTLIQFSENKQQKINSRQN